MTELPPELLMHIFSFLREKDLCQLESVCKKTQAAAAEDSTWKQSIGKSKEARKQQLSLITTFFTGPRLDYAFHLITDNPLNNPVTQLMASCTQWNGRYEGITLGDKQAYLWHDATMSPDKNLAHACKTVHTLYQGLLIFCMDNEEELNALLRKRFESDDVKPLGLAFVINSPKTHVIKSDSVFTYALKPETKKERFFSDLVTILRKNAPKSVQEKWAQETTKNSYERPCRVS